MATQFGLAMGYGAAKIAADSVVREQSSNQEFADTPIEDGRGSAISLERQIEACQRAHGSAELRDTV